MVPPGGTRVTSSRYSLQQGKFSLDRRIKFFQVRMFNHWNRAWEKLWKIRDFQNSTGKVTENAAENLAFSLTWKLAVKLDQMIFRCFI